MNCRRVEKLIPLYVEGDLAADEAGAVLSHSLTCARCGGLVAEYEQSQRWLRSYTPPDFDDASLQDLKLNVLREIGRRGGRGAFLDALAERWTARLVIAATAASLIILAALAFHIHQRRAGEAAGRDGLVAGGGAEPGERPGGVAPREQALKLAPRADFIRKHRRRPATAPHVESVAGRFKEREPSAGRLDAKVAGRPGPAETEGALAGERATPPGVLRIEIQTSDPSIRIIWFSRKESAGHRAKPITESD